MNKLAPDRLYEKLHDRPVTPSDYSADEFEEEEV